MLSNVLKIKNNAVADLLKIVNIPEAMIKEKKLG